MSYKKTAPSAFRTSRRQARTVASSPCEDASEEQTPPRRSYALVLATPSPRRLNASPRKVNVGPVSADERYVLLISSSEFLCNHLNSVIAVTDSSPESASSVEKMYVLNVRSDTAIIILLFTFRQK